MIWMVFFLGLVIGLVGGFLVVAEAMMNRADQLWPVLKKLAEIEAKAKALGGRKNWRGKWVL